MRNALAPGSGYVVVSSDGCAPRIFGTGEFTAPPAALYAEGNRCFPLAQIVADDEEVLLLFATLAFSGRN